MEVVSIGQLAGPVRARQKFLLRLGVEFVLKRSGPVRSGSKVVRSGSKMDPVRSGPVLRWIRSGPVRF